MLRADGASPPLPTETGSLPMFFRTASTASGSPGADRSASGRIETETNFAGDRPISRISGSKSSATADRAWLSGAAGTVILCFLASARRRRAACPLRLSDSPARTSLLPASFFPVLR